MNQTFLNTAPLPMVPEIFRGTPSQVVNLGPFAKGAIASVVIVAIYSELAPRIELSSLWVIVPLLGVGLLVLARYLELALTSIVIDEERITVKLGVFSKRTLSLELFRIQDVTAIVPWYQRPFGVGTVLVESSDTTNPELHLVGIHHPDDLRDRLNRAAIALRDRKGIREINMGRV